VSPFQIDFQGKPRNNPAVARIALEHLTKLFPGPAGEPVRTLADVSLTIEDREMLVLLGPSGCGKTTTLRLLAGLETPSSGTLRFNEQIINHLPAGKRDIAMVFQNPALYPHMTVFGNMALGLKLRNCPRAEIERRVAAAAELLDLSGCLDRRPMELSGGQAQRVALGRAIVRRPELFLFDEPLSNLDPQLRATMRVELSRLHARLGATSVYVTHDQTEAMTLGHRIAVMNHGAIQQVAQPLELYRCPANLFVASFIGSPPMNLIEGTLFLRDARLFFQCSAGENGTANLCLAVADSMAGTLTKHAGRKLVLGLRPEHIALVESRTKTPPENAVDALVERLEHLGAETCLHMARGPLSFIVRVNSRGVRCAGESLPVAFDMRQAVFFASDTGNSLLCAS
jgi:multiple sugar transport system ATP-binding protein